MNYSVINFKKVVASSDSIRLDAEYFQIQPLLEKIAKQKTIVLYKISKWITQGPNPKFSDSGIPCLTGRNISSGNLLFDNSDIVDEAEYADLIKFKLKRNDILITLKGAGSTGKVSLFDTDKKSIFSRNLGLIRLKEKQRITPEFMFAFFSSDLGQTIIDRGVTGGTGQLTLPTSYLKNLKIPLFSESFVKNITQLIKAYTKQKCNSLSLYNQAEQTLLSELNLLNWKPRHQLSFIKNFSDTKTVDRIDAEYFQPKYKEIIAAIKLTKKYVRLGDVVKFKDKNFTPKDDVTYKYIELANISANGNINGFMETKGKELPSRARRKVNSGDLIVSSIEGSLSSIALIPEDLDSTLCSTGFIIINSNEINSETLLVLLKSLVGQLQLKKGCSGTILTAINKEEFNNLILPKFSSKVQEEIKQKISEMYKARALAKNLLDVAKRGVEMAIEKNEEEAQIWIDSELKTELKREKDN